MSAVDELLAFVRRCLDEEERVARAASPAPWRREYYAAMMHAVADATGRELFGEGHLAESSDVRHIALWDPKRALDEVKAKRQILDLYDREDSTLPPPHWAALEEVIKLLAQPFAGREGWREEWALDTHSDGS